MNFEIKFRPLRPEDAMFINQLRQKDDMEKLIGGSSRPVSYERDLKWVTDLIMNDNQTMIYYAITTLNDDQIIGYTSISDIDYRNGSCFWSGIKLDRSTSRKGFGTQVALKVLAFAFEELRMVRCAAECQEGHEAAFKMLLKVGYQEEGLMRKRLFKNGVSNNQRLLSVIDDDYKEIKAKFDL
jgi:ribosomal-protein-alanine N-acetyltransferase